MAISAFHTEPKSQHVADSNIQAFLQADFDPAEYLNASLPSLSTSSNARSGSFGRAVPLPELSAQLQSLLSQLNAQTSRLSTTLTQLTDEIIRSGSRLAYEVDVLKGETTGLTDLLDNGLKKDIELLAPSAHARQSMKPDAGDEHELVANNADVTSSASAEPEYLERLRSLAVVRARLDSVVKVFGDAMAWPLAPSETSSLLSISAPESDADSRSREAKGKEFADQLRNDLNELIGSGNDAAGLEAAASRLEELKQLAEVWKGTAEEKARLRLVETLQKPIEDRQSVLGNTSNGRKPAVSSSSGYDLRYGNMDAAPPGGESGYGFLQNLRNLKNDMYLE